MTLESGDRRRMEDLMVGDSILTVEDGAVVATRVLGFLDKDVHNTYDNYIRMSLATGGQLHISPTHLLFVQEGEDRVVSRVALIRLNNHLQQTMSLKARLGSHQSNCIRQRSKPILNTLKVPFSYQKTITKFF